MFSCFMAIRRSFLRYGWRKKRAGPKGPPELALTFDLLPYLGNRFRNVHELCYVNAAG